jgi:transcription elongation factor Elf1
MINMLKHKLPPLTERFCGYCERMTSFKYNHNIGHSECTKCGMRYAFRDKESYLKSIEKFKLKGDPEL